MRRNEMFRDQGIIASSLLYEATTFIASALVRLSICLNPAITREDLYFHVPRHQDLYFVISRVSFDHPSLGQGAPTKHLNRAPKAAASISCNLSLV